jgi:hypothetical protein
MKQLISSYHSYQNKTLRLCVLSRDKFFMHRIHPTLSCLYYTKLNVMMKVKNFANCTERAADKCK